MTPRACLALLALSLGSSASQADTLYKCINESGRVEYTNLMNSTKKCTVLSSDQTVSTFTGPKPRSRTPGDFPRVDGDTQRSRDSDRRKILEQEFATEQQDLDKARKALTEVEAARSTDEKSYRNYLDRLPSLKDAVTLHARNVEALRHELANLK